MSHRTSLLDVFSRLGRPRVLVVGDAMLDRYIEGEVTRLSPEAPVPVLKIKHERGCPGGAANTASFLAALGCHTTLSGVVGDDPWGDDLRTMLFHRDVDISSLWRVHGLRTICKQRVLSTSGARQYQHLLRLDYEPQETVLGGHVREDLLADAKHLLEAGEFDIVAISDYRKHTIPEELKHFWLEQREVPVVVDGKPGGHYYGARLLKMNHSETETELGIKLMDSAGYMQAAERLRQTHNLPAALVTLGPRGMALAQHGKKPIHLLPEESREVYDVTGAGDMVLAVLAWGLGSGVELEEVLALSQRAALWEVERMGCVPLLRTQLERELRGLVACRTCGNLADGDNGCYDHRTNAVTSEVPESHEAEVREAEGS